MFICDTNAFKAGICTEAEIGKAIIDTSVESTVRSKSLDFTNEEETGLQFFEYQVHKTGYYCVMTWPVQVDEHMTSFTGILEFKNKYGFLAGVDFPKLPVRGESCLFLRANDCLRLMCT